MYSSYSALCNIPQLLIICYSNLSNMGLYAFSISEFKFP